MVSRHRRGEHQEQYQYEPQPTPVTSLRGDESYGERQSAAPPYGNGEPAAQQPPTYPGNPGGHAAADANQQLLAQVKISIDVVLKDLDKTKDEIEGVRQRASKRQEDANLVLNWVPCMYSALQEEAHMSGNPLPPLLISPRLELRLRKDLSNFNRLQKDVEGHVQAAQMVCHQVQVLRDCPTLSFDQDGASEDQLQEKMALLREKRQEMQQQMTSLRSTSQGVEAWNFGVRGTYT